MRDYSFLNNKFVSVFQHFPQFVCEIQQSVCRIFVKFHEPKIFPASSYSFLNMLYSFLNRATGIQSGTGGLRLWRFRLFSAFHDEGINLEGLLEILSPENNLVLADDMMVSDGNGIILRVSETYEKNFGFAHDSIVGKSAFDLEADGTFTPCITAEVIRRRKKISATQTINHTHKKRDDRGHSPV